jgi:hypothetical protein
VIRASKRAFERSSAASEQNRSTSHGDAKEWEEAHNEQEDESSQDGEEGRAHRAEDWAGDGTGGAEDRAQDEREKGPGPQDSQAEYRAQVYGEESCCPQTGSQKGAGP